MRASVEPQKDKNDVGLESGMTWAKKAPNSESNDTEANATAEGETASSAAPAPADNSVDEPASEGPAPETAETAQSEPDTKPSAPNAEESPSEAADANSETPAEPSAPEATATESDMSATEASSEKPDAASPDAGEGANKDSTEEGSATATDSADGAPTTESVEPKTEETPDKADGETPVAVVQEVGAAEEKTENQATVETKADDDTKASDPAVETEETTPTATEGSDNDSSSPSSPPPLETVREGIVGKDFKKDDTQRVKIQKPEEVSQEKTKELETKDEGPQKGRNSARNRAPSRSAAQDAVVGAVVFIDDYAVGSLGETPPSPFTKVGGVSLLRRAVLTAREAGLTTLHCLTKPQLRDLATQEVTVKGVEAVFVNSLEEAPFPKEGRVIYIDPRALHDIESLKRLQKWRGARVALLCSKLGDGIRVQIEGVRVREIGTDLVPFDACTGGAISIPMELMPRILDEGYQKMLRDMVDEELLGASFTASTTAREVRRESEVDDVRSSLLSNMGLNSDGLMDSLIHRRISNHLTRSIYTIDWIKPSAITALACLFGLLAGPLFALAGSVGIAALFATLSLWLSVILDSVDGELARLKQQESQSGRLFDRCSKALVQLSVISGLVSWFGYDNLMVLIPGAVFALGQVIAAFVSYSQPPRLTEGHQVSLGDRIDGLILNQNYFYLACPLFIAAAFLERSQGALIVAGVLAFSAFMIHISWIGLKVVGTKNRLPS